MGQTVIADWGRSVRLQLGRNDKVGEEQVDLLILGAGMAGLTAAAWTAEHGGSVLLVERSGEIGGSSKWASYFHTAKSVDALREFDPGGLPHMQEQLVNGFSEAADWVKSLGAERGDEVQVSSLTFGRQIDTNAYATACAKIIGRQRILLDTVVSDLRTEGGRVVGARITTNVGEVMDVTARWTLLATGGIQGDAQLVRQHIGPQGDQLPLRANFTSVGDGVRLGIGAGGRVGVDGASFYGHLSASGVRLNDAAEFELISGHYYSRYGLLFNLEGERFTDESQGDHYSASELSRQTDGRALFIVDQRIRDQRVLTHATGSSEVIDGFEVARRRNARIGVADDLEELAYLPDDWGYPGEKIADGIRTFNDSLTSGAALDPPREYERDPLVDPPYYVLEVVPAITFAYAGLMVDRLARVLTEDDEPIDGLLAAGADAGGTYSRGYAGGLSMAAVGGIRAARTALTDSER